MEVRELQRIGVARRSAVERASALLANDALSAAELTELDELRVQIDDLDARAEPLRRLERMVEAQQDMTPETGAPARPDYSRYSLLRAVRHALGRLGPWEDAGFELECQQELRSSSPGRPYEGIPVPLEALSTRAPATTTTADDLTYTVHRPDMYLDALRDSLISGRLGIRVLTGLSGNLDIPTYGSDQATVAWATETGAFSETTPTFDQQTLGPAHKLGAWSEWTQQLVLTSAPGIEGLVRSQLVEAVARAIDQAMLYGGVDANAGGTHQINDGDAAPRGLVYQISGTTADNAAVTGNTARTGDTNGKALTFAELEALQLALDQANVPGDGRMWLLAPRTRNSLRGLPRFDSDGDRAAELAYRNGAILGDPAVVSNAVPINQTHGTGGANKSSIYYGRWSDMIMGYWQGLDLMLNPYADTSFKRGSILIRAMLFMDMLVQRDESFEYYDAVIP